MDKRGQELSIGTLVLIVLGIIVLVLLILGFSVGWENLFSKIGITTGSDLSAMVAACKVAAAANSKVDFCEYKRVKIAGKPEEINCGDSNVIAADSSLQAKETEYACGPSPKNTVPAGIAATG